MAWSLTTRTAGKVADAIGVALLRACRALLLLAGVLAALDGPFAADVVLSLLLCKVLISAVVGVLCLAWNAAVRAAWRSVRNR